MPRHKNKTSFKKGHVGIKTFQKGHIPWTKGKKLSKETKQKISKGNKGKKRSEEARKNIGLAQKQRFQKSSVWNKGLKGFKAGEKHWNWHGGISKHNKSERQFLMQTFEYKLWRKSVFERDHYTCIWCGKRGGELHADHIKSWRDYPELRFAIDNGRTLCVDCHKKTDTYGGKNLR